MMKKITKQMKMRIPIGVDDFKELIENTSSEDEHYFYCDKSMMIKDVIDDGAKILLFTRPRRFGKTLNMSMLKYFFGSKDPLFEGLKIADNQHIMDTYNGRYPVISVSFKALKYLTFEELLQGMSDIVRNAFADHQHTFAPDDPLLHLYSDISKPLELTNISTFISRLSRHLENHYGQKVLVLIDEYDAPIQTGYLNGYYEQVIALMRNLFEDGLKGNNSVFKGVLTGITRVAKANLFSGLNHFRNYDIDAEKYSHYFGFTEEETRKIVGDHYEGIKEWYNGYTFGKDTIYNPWSILNFLDNSFKYLPYWINTAENLLIQKSLTADKMADVKTLINGGAISLKIDNNLILKYLDVDTNAFFNLLYTAGYLTSAGEGGDLYEKFVRIPNREVKEFFKTSVLQWFGHGRGGRFLEEFLSGLINGDNELVEDHLSTMLLESFSFHDGTRRDQESFYHGFLLGLSLGLKGKYIVKSNRESGFGRYDLALYPVDPSKHPGIIIEVKTKPNKKDAILQIKDQAYATDLYQHGSKNILLYGFYFIGKTVKTKLVSA